MRLVTAISLLSQLSIEPQRALSRAPAGVNREPLGPIRRQSYYSYIPLIVLVLTKPTSFPLRVPGPVFVAVMGPDTHVALPPDIIAMLPELDDQQEKFLHAGPGC